MELQADTLSAAANTHAQPGFHGEPAGSFRDERASGPPTKPAGGVQTL